MGSGTRTLVLLALLASLAATATATRALQQGGQAPPECGQLWTGGDIACSIPCPGGNVAFSCKTEDSGYSATCNVEPPGGPRTRYLCGISNNSATGKLYCNLEGFESRWPECAREPIRRILNTWQPNSR